MLTLDHSPVNSHPGVLGGTLVFKGTRVKAQTLLDYLDAGDSLEDFLEDFPTVNQDDAVRAIPEFIDRIRTAILSAKEGEYIQL